MTRVLKIALHGILPVWRTFPTAALHKEAALPPMDFILDQRCQRFANRINQLDKRHPLYRRTNKPRAHTIETRLIRSKSPAEHTDPLLLPPWAVEHKPVQYIPGCSPGTTHAAAKAAFEDWLERQDPLDLFVYSDGSRIDPTDPNAGAGWAVFWRRRQDQIRLGHQHLPNAEVFDAEAVAALQGLDTALKCYPARYSRNLHILLDNLEAVRQLQQCAPCLGSSQAVFQAFHKHAKAWPTRPGNIRPGQGQVHVHWIPGHAGI